MIKGTLKETLIELQLHCILVPSSQCSGNCSFLQTLEALHLGEDVKIEKEKSK